jgi:hypothetical protein
MIFFVKRTKHYFNLIKKKLDSISPYEYVIIHTATTNMKILLKKTTLQQNVIKIKSLISNFKSSNRLTLINHK